MFRPVLRPSSGMSIRKSYAGRYDKIESKRLLVYSHYFLVKLNVYYKKIQYKVLEIKKIKLYIFINL